jgi:NADPH-dependent glutamate synthase beta subunit-like oxidoreductase
MGVEYRTEQNVAIDDLKKQYEKVFIGCGLGQYKAMHIPGEEGEGVYKAGDFLKAVNLKVSYGEGDGINFEGHHLCRWGG